MDDKNQRIVLEGNAFYEIDLACLNEKIKKEKEIQKKRQKINEKRQRK